MIIVIHIVSLALVMVGAFSMGAIAATVAAAGAIDEVIPETPLLKSEMQEKYQGAILWSLLAIFIGAVLGLWPW